MNTNTIEKRVEILEAEVQELKQKVNKGERTWLEVMAGSFENDPDFEEVVRLGREFRETQGLADED